MLRMRSALGQSEKGGQQTAVAKSIDKQSIYAAWSAFYLLSTIVDRVPEKTVKTKMMMKQQTV